MQDLTIYYLIRHSNSALRYWGDVLEYMRGNLKLNKLPKSLQSSSFAIRKLIDDYQQSYHQY